jgi:hypothetical protein
MIKCCSDWASIPYEIRRWWIKCKYILLSSFITIQVPHSIWVLHIPFYFICTGISVKFIKLWLPLNVTRSPSGLLDLHM